MEELEKSQLEEMRLKVLGDINNTTKDNIFKINLKDAKYIALGTLYPFELEIDTLPKRIAESWQVRCAIELYSLLEEGAYISYSENGLSWQRASELVSKDLMNELTPKAGVPK